VTAVPEEPASGNVCKHCRKPVIIWSLSMDGNHGWKHQNGGYILCIVGDSRPGTHAELAEQADAPTRLPGFCVSPKAVNGQHAWLADGRCMNPWCASRRHDAD
jgi:hypothetical protein